MIGWLRSVLRARPADLSLAQAQRERARAERLVAPVVAEARDVKDRILEDYRRFDGALRRQVRS